MSALLNLSWRYLTWGHGGGVIVGDDPPPFLVDGPLPVGSDRGHGSGPFPGLAIRRLLTMNHVPSD